MTQISPAEAFENDGLRYLRSGNAAGTAFTVFIMAEGPGRF